MKGMNQFAKTHSHALTLLKGSMEKKKANFYVEKGYPSLNHFLVQKHRTPFYGEIEMGVKKIKGNIQHHVHCFLREIHPLLLKLLLKMNNYVLMNDGNPKFRIIHQHLKLVITLITKQLN